MRDYPALTERQAFKTKLCLTCGRPFAPTNGRQLACSKACGAQIGKYQAKPKTNVDAAKPSGPTHLSSSQLDGAKARARLYRELLAFITEGKGWVVSEPGCSPLRFESIDSSLADQLRGAGHKVLAFVIGIRQRCTASATGPL